MASGEELSLLLLVLPARERPAYMFASTTVEVCLTRNSCQIPSSFGLSFSKVHLSILCGQRVRMKAVSSGSHMKA